MPTDFFVANQHDLKGLPELQFNAQDVGGDIWLRVPRLHEIAPPQPDNMLRPRLTLPKAPTKLPELKSQIEIYNGRQLLRSELLEEHPAVTELFDWYLENQWQPWAAAETPRRQTIKRYNEMFALQQTIATEGTETQIEVVWGLGYAVWKKDGFGSVLNALKPMLLDTPILSAGIDCTAKLNDVWKMHCIAIKSQRAVI